MAFKVKILILFNFLILVGCATKKKVGEIIDEKYIITTDLESIKNDWNKILTENKIEGKLSNFEIRKDFDTNEKPQEYFFFIGYSSDNMVKMATIVQKKGKKFFFTDLKEQRVAICHGIPDCMPKRFKNDHWGCDCDVKNLFDCKKTEVIIFK